MREQAEALLSTALGPGAVFRDGQWEAISALVEERARVLVVQRTGWGKSLVYFLATRLLRDRGSGPTLLISPLLSLMRNQLEMGSRLGVRSHTINSANIDEWGQVERALARDECDLLMISPERLGNQHFLDRVLPSLQRGLGLFVVDEAHCISDWGHDFRPDYRRIVRIVRALPPRTPLLATTATANDRVVADVVAQLGAGLQVLRGPLARASLRIQTTRLDRQEERLAWLARYLPTLPGTGIVYCLTIADCDRVSRWLESRGLRAPAYHSERTAGDREILERALLGNEVKTLVATVALGMGFDKPDLGFVVHYQRPGSVVAYYQQIGRAGRAVEAAFAILLSGAEDDEIQEYFIRTAFPTEAEIQQVVATIEQSDGLTVDQIMRRVNQSRTQIQKCLAFLEVERAVTKAGAVYHRTVNPFRPDLERAAAVTAQRHGELERMRAFVDWPGCLMEFISRELDDPAAAPCGRCARCAGECLPARPDPSDIASAVSFLRGDVQKIKPRLQWIGSARRRGRIGGSANLEGRALCVYGDAGWGREVARDKYEENRYRDELVVTAAETIRRWAPEPRPRWVTAVPSLRRPDLVPDFARRLARQLGIPFREAIRKTRPTPEQKTMQNSAQQLANVEESLQAVDGLVLAAPVLLVDDIVDSGWTLTVCGALLREAGSGPIHPFALAAASTRNLP